MKTAWIALVLVIALFLAGCSCSPQELCAPPSIPAENGCCIDNNGNGVCDRNEGTNKEAGVGNVPSKEVECEDGKITKLPEINDPFGNEQSDAMIRPDTISINQGDIGKFVLHLRDTISAASTFYATMEVQEVPNSTTKEEVSKWIKYDKAGLTVPSGSSGERCITVNVPKTAPIGYYTLAFTINCNDEVLCPKMPALELDAFFQVRAR